ncbi:MAG: hypothetical protein RLO52_13955 [Sandaracinaceae bacterium]
MSFLDLLAPWAVARIVVRDLGVEDPVTHVAAHLRKRFSEKPSDGSSHRFRVEGDALADLRAVGVVVGSAPARSHYARVGFDLLLRRRDDGDVALEARERVVLGWWEREAVGEVLQGRLEEIREDLVSSS